MKLSMVLMAFSFAELVQQGSAGPLNLSLRSPGTRFYTSTLTRSSGKLNLARLRPRQETTGSGVLYPYVPAGKYFLTDISIGSQSFKVTLDTGSSDLWLAQTGYTCYEKSTNEPTTSSMCNMGPTYNPDGSFTHIPNENFLIRYTEGTFAAGIVGYDSVTLAGLTVPQQELGLAQEVS
jgi:Eukaryotic aspartyl protease